MSMGLLASMVVKDSECAVCLEQLLGILRVACADTNHALTSIERHKSSLIDIRFLQTDKSTANTRSVLQNCSKH